MLDRYRHTRRMMARGALVTLAAAVFVAFTGFAAHAQTIYFVNDTTTPSTDFGTACTTNYFVDSDGNLGSYMSCTPSYTIYYVPGDDYFFIGP